MLIDFNHTYHSYQQIAGHYGVWEYACPKCKKEGQLRRHASYERFLCVLEKDKIEERKISILRLRCGACGSTHAILTWDMVPFCIYSLSVMLTIIKNVFIQKQPVLEKEAQTGISFQVIYRFLWLWKSYMQAVKPLLHCDRSVCGGLASGDTGCFSNLCSNCSSTFANLKEFLMKNFTLKHVSLFSKRKNSEKYPLYFGVIEGNSHSC